MAKRKIRQKRIPGFQYETPRVRRTVGVQGENEDEDPQVVSQVPPENDFDRGHHPEKDPENPSESPVSLPRNPASPHPQPRQPSPNSTPPVSPSPPISQSHLPQNSVTAPSQTRTHPESLDELLTKIYKYKDSPAAYSAAVQRYIDSNYSLSLHKQRRKRFLRRPFLVYDPMDCVQVWEL